jgi:hypothetical protein
MPRHVKGSLFVDYVRMLRVQKRIDWSRHLEPADLAYLSTQIEPDGWYPMESFERFGLAILAEIAHDDLIAVRMWGGLSTEIHVELHPTLLVPNDPCESLMRFLVLRQAFFDFECLQIPHLTDTEAKVSVNYGMNRRAEQAAAFQTVGFFSRFVELAGGRDVRSQLTARSWEGDAETTFTLEWSPS